MATLKIGIREEAKSFVEDAARERGSSEADVVRRALEAYRYLETLQATDGEVIVKRRDGTFERLVRF